MSQSLEDIFGMPSATQAPKSNSNKKPKKPSLDEIFGSENTTETKPKKTLKKVTPQLQLSDIYKAANPFTLPWKDYDPTKMGVIGQTVTSFAAGAQEGFSFGKNVVKGEERLTKALKPASTAGRFFGEFTRQILEIGVAGKAVEAVKAVPWIAKAVDSPKVSKALEKYATPLVRQFGDAVARGSVFSGIEQAIAPKERKPGVKGTAMNMAMFGAGEVGGSLARNVLIKNVPKVNPHIENLASLVGDTVSSTVAGLPFVDDDGKKNLIKEGFGPDVLAIGMYDVLAYAASKGKVKLTNNHSFDRPIEQTVVKPNNDEILTNDIVSELPDEATLKIAAAKDALNDYVETGSEASLHEYWDTVNQLEVDIPPDPIRLYMSEDNNVSTLVSKKQMSTDDNHEVAYDVRLNNVFKFFDVDRDLDSWNERLETLYGEPWWKAGKHEDYPFKRAIPNDWIQKVLSSELSIPENKLNELLSKVTKDNTVSIDDIINDDNGLIKEALLNKGYDAISYRDGGSDDIVYKVLNRKTLDKIYTKDKQTNTTIYHKPIFLYRGEAVPAKTISEIGSKLNLGQKNISEGKAKIIAENSDIVYMTTDKDVAQSYAEIHNDATTADGFDPSIFTFEVTPRKIWDISTDHLNLYESLKDMFSTESSREQMNKDQLTELLKSIGVTNEEDLTTIIKATGESFIDPFSLLRDEALPIIRKALEKRGYDGVHYTEGAQDNYAFFNKDIIKKASRRSLMSELEMFYDDFLNEKEMEPNTYKKALESQITSFEKQIEEDRQWLKDNPNALVANENVYKDRIKENKAKIDWIRKEIEKIKDVSVAPSQQLQEESEQNKDSTEGLNNDEGIITLPENKQGSERLNLGSEMEVSVNDEQLQRIQKLSSDMTKPISLEEIQKIRSLKPPEAPFNLTRIDARTGALIGLDEIGRETDTTSPISLETTEEMARNELQLDASQWKTMADELQMSVNEVKQLAEQTENFHSKFVKIRAHLAASAGELLDLSTKIDSGNATELDYAKFLYRIQTHSTLSEFFKRGQTNIARTLSAFRVIVPEKGWMSLGDLSIDDLKMSTDAKVHVDDIINGAGGVDNIKKMAKKMKESKDLAGFTKQSKAVASKGFMQKAATWFTSSLLTNPVTHMTNTVGQALNDVLERTTDFAQLGVSNLREIAAPGTKGLDRANASMVMKKLSGDVQGFFHAFLNPIVSVKDVDGHPHAVDNPSVTDYILKIASSPAQLPINIIKNTVNAVIDPKGQLGKIQGSTLNPYKRSTVEGLELSDPNNPVNPNTDTSLGMASKVFSYVSNLQQVASFGLLELGDRPFSYGAYFSEMKAKVDWVANMSGIKNRRQKAKYRGELENAVKNYRRSQILGEEMPDMISEVTGENLIETVKQIDSMALQQEETMTWKDPIEGGLTRTIEESVLKRFPETRFFFPFWHTPIKILERWSDYTPGLNLWSSKARNDLKGLNGPDAQDRMIAKWVVGTTIYGIAGAMVFMGKVTPSAANDEQRKRFRDAGIPEKAIKIGNEWVEINRLDPAAMFVGLVADAININHLLDSETASDVFNNLLAASAKNTTEKTYMQGFKNLTMLASGQGGDMFGRIAEGFIPFSGAGRFVREISNDTLWEADSMMERIKATHTRELLDSYGKPVPTPDRLWGIKVSEPSDSPIRTEAGRLGANLNPPGDTVFQTKLTPDQRWQMHKAMDDDYHVEDKLNELINDDNYQSQPDFMKKQLIEDMYSDIKYMAEADFLEKDPNMKDAYEKVLLALEEQYSGSSSEDVFGPWYNQQQ